MSQQRAPRDRTTAPRPAQDPAASLSRRLRVAGGAARAHARGGARGSARSAFFFRGARRVGGRHGGAGRGAHAGQAGAWRGRRACARCRGGAARASGHKRGASPRKKKALLFCASASAPSRARWRPAGHLGHAFTPNDSLSASGCEERSRRAAGAALGALGAQPRPYVPLSSSAFPFLRCASAARSRRARRARGAPVTTICSAA